MQRDYTTHRHFQFTRPIIHAFFAAVAGVALILQASSGQQLEQTKVLGIREAAPFLAKGSQTLSTRSSSSNPSPNYFGVDVAAAGGGLNIVPQFDSSITSDPDSTRIMNTINAAIAVYRAAFCDTLTVNIKFQKVNTGLGASSTFVNNVSYVAYLAALTAAATTPNDSIALANLPPGPNNPVTGDPNMRLATAHLRILGLPGGSVALDSTISLNTSICNLDRTTIDPSKYDLMAVVMHEINEALSIGSVLDNMNNGDPAPTGAVKPADLFRYDAAGNRSLTTASGAQAFFSIDGIFQMARFNQSDGGDFGDWFSTGAHIPQVQDAFGTAGATPNLGVELVRLDVIGFCLVALPKITTPGEVSFAETCVAGTSFTTLNVCNTGTADLQVGPITSSDPQFSVVTPSSGYPVTISPDFCFPFRVRFSPTSAGDKTATLTIPSNDPTSPSTPVQAFGKGVGPKVAAFIADSGNFGDVCIGGFRDLNLTINNSGGCTMKITGISSSSSQFLVPTVQNYPLVIHPGDSVAVPIRFQPSTLGGKIGTIIINSDDPLSPKLVSVSGSAPAGDVRVTGSTDFGDVCAGGPTAEKTISICNVGKCNLLVTNVAFNPACGDFTLINNPFPAVVSHDSCVDVVIRYTPTSCGPKQCRLVIRTDDPETPVINLTVTANTPCASIDVPPDMAFPPTVISSFGPCRSVLPFPISNTGTCPLWIANIRISGAQAADYSFVGLPSFPIILEQGHIVGEGDLGIAFAPAALGRERHATITVTYIVDPVAGTTANVTREFCGEGVQTGGRVLVMQGNIPVPKVEKIQLQRINANRNKDPLDTHDVIQDATLVTSVPGAPCEVFQYHREYGTVSNPIQLLPGAYQVTVSAIINGKRKSKTVGFDVDTCTFNPQIVIKY